MFEKNLRISYLLDFYGEALDEHTRSVMTAYYEDDLSLGEIATDEGISRQGVRHIIKKGEEQLSFLEEKLGLCAYNERLVACTEILSEVLLSLDRYDDAEHADMIKKIESVKDTILNK